MPDPRSVIIATGLLLKLLHWAGRGLVIIKASGYQQQYSGASWVGEDHICLARGPATPSRTWTEAADGAGLLGEPVGERPRPARPPLGVRPLPAPGAEAMGDVMPMVGAGAAAAHDLITPALRADFDMAWLLLNRTSQSRPVANTILN